MRIAAPLAARRGTPNSTFSMPVTPGCTSAKLYGLRATSGRLCTSRSLIVWPMSMRAMSSAGMSAPLTVIVSLTRADRQRRVHDRGLADRQLNVGPFEFLESLQLRDDAVLAERQQRRAIETFFVGRRPSARCRCRRW